MALRLKDCPVPILQNEWEFTTFLSIYKSLAPKKIVEIGSFYGGTLWFWLNEQNWNLQEIMCIDLPVPANDGRYEEMKRCRSLWQSWIDGRETGISEFTEPVVKLHDIQGNSQGVGIGASRQAFPNNDVDLLYIDGDHSYSGVKADYENYQQLVRPGGVIVFHDVAGIPDVKRFWDEVKFGKQYIELAAAHEGWGTGIIFKQ